MDLYVDSFLALLNNLNLTPVFLLTDRLNGSLPQNVEIRNNTLLFRGPVTKDFSGTYICDATNSIGTRSGLVEVNVTGMLRLLRNCLCVYIY